MDNESDRRWDFVPIQKNINYEFIPFQDRPL
jgi:hypothetical protein